jgi:hypothetical protein
MLGIATLQDGSEIPLVLVNLSYDGCAVESSVPLQPGSTLILTTRGGVIDAEVRWASGSQAGLLFSTSPLARIQETDGLATRKSERVPVKLNARMKRFGRGSFLVSVTDLSVTGCKVEYCDRPEVEETVAVGFEGLGSIEAKVRWISGTECGLDFACPFHPAVLELLLQRHSG